MLQSSPFCLDFRDLNCLVSPVLFASTFFSLSSIYANYLHQILRICSSYYQALNPFSPALYNSNPFICSSRIPSHSAFRTKISLQVIFLLPRQLVPFRTSISIRKKEKEKRSILSFAKKSLPLFYKIFYWERSKVYSPMEEKGILIKTLSNMKPKKYCPPIKWIMPRGYPQNNFSSVWPHKNVKPFPNKVKDKLWFWRCMHMFPSKDSTIQKKKKREKKRKKSFCIFIAIKTPPFFTEDFGTSNALQNC